jgi:hypothetical protein
MYFHSRLAIIAIVISLCSSQGYAQFFTREYYKNKISIDHSLVARVDTVYRAWQSIEYFDANRVLRYRLDIDTLRKDTMGFEQFDYFGDSFDFYFYTDQEGYFNVHIHSNGGEFAYQLRPNYSLDFVYCRDQDGVFKTVDFHENSFIQSVYAGKMFVGYRQMSYSTSGKLVFDADFNNSNQIIHVRKGRRWAKRNYMRFAPG